MHTLNTGRLYVCERPLHEVVALQLNDVCRMGYSLDGKEGLAEVGDPPLCMPPGKQSVYLPKATAIVATTLL